MLIPCVVSYGWLGADWTAISAIATIGYLIFTIGLWRSTRAAARAAVKSADTAERTAKLLYVPAVQVVTTSHEAEGRLFFKFKMQNFGPVQARNVRMEMTVYHVGATTQEIPVQLPPVDLAPGSDTTHVRHYYGENTQHILKGAVEVRFVGRVEYDDPLGNHFVGTTFSKTYDPATRLVGNFQPE